MNNIHDFYKHFHGPINLILFWHVIFFISPSERNKFLAFASQARVTQQLPSPSKRVHHRSYLLLFFLCNSIKLMSSPIINITTFYYLCLQIIWSICMLTILKCIIILITNSDYIDQACFHWKYRMLGISDVTNQAIKV